MLIVLYKLKDEENIKEILFLSQEFNFDVVIIHRENANIRYEELKKIKDFKIYYTFDDFLKEYSNKKFYFIETYGNKFLYEAELDKNGIYVFGAEDYGIPYHEIEKVKDKEVIKIPVKKPGSYNVTSTVVMLLTELKCRGLL